MGNLCSVVWACEIIDLSLCVTDGDLERLVGDTEGKIIIIMIAFDIMFIEGQWNWNFSIHRK